MLARLSDGRPPTSTNKNLKHLPLITIQMEAFQREPLCFECLPLEIVVAILLKLDWRTVLRIQLVNKDFNDVVKNHKALQYHVELGIAGMVDGLPYPHSPFTTDKRLAGLLLYQSRWKRLEPARQQKVRATKGTVWELAGGVLAQGITSATGIDDSEFPGTSDVRKLFFTRLPSDARAKTKTLEWTHEGYEFPIRDFTLDPAQDLLVLVRAETNQNQSSSVELHLRSLRTNEKHPSAKLGVLSHGLEGGTRPYAHLMQICEARFCVLHSGLNDVWPEKLVVYNWKTGTLEFAIEFCGIISFSFLTYNHLLLAVHPFNVMPARQGDQQPRLIVCDIDRTAMISPSGNPCAYAALCEFHLPELRQYAEVEDVLIRTEPTPSYDYENNSTGQQTTTFTTAPHNRLFVITINVVTVLDDTGDHRASTSHTLVIFVPLSTFLPFLHAAVSAEVIPANFIDEDLFFGDSTKWPPRRIAVAWTDWLRDGARMLLVPGAERVWVCNVYGTRFVHALEPRDMLVPRAARHIAVLDFNVDAMRRDRAFAPLSAEEKELESSLGGETHAEVEEHMRSSTLEAKAYGIFEEDVTTCLPYRRVVLPEKVRFDGVMLTEDNIIFVNRGAPREFNVLIF